MTRREAIRVGALAFGGLTLADVLRSRAATAYACSGPARNKSVIMIFLSGGPPHQDMVDLKPDAPAEIRGELGSIKSSLPGCDVCELLPKLARIADKYTVIRSITTLNNPGGRNAIGGQRRLVAKIQMIRLGS